MRELLSLPMMANRLRVTHGWLRSEAESGNIPHLKAGKRFLFNPAAVTEHLAVVAARRGKAPRSPVDLNRELGKLVVATVEARRSGNRKLEAEMLDNLKRKYGVALAFLAVESPDSEVADAS